VLILLGWSIGPEPIGLCEPCGLEVVFDVEEEGEEAEDDALVVGPRSCEGLSEGVVVGAAEESEDGLVAGWEGQYLRKLVRWDWTILRKMSRLCCTSLALPPLSLSSR
jgi:hypothetical protein